MFEHKKAGKQIHVNIVFNTYNVSKAANELKLEKKPALHGKRNKSN